MLINLRRFGRLGNRLFLFAHLIAFARKFRVPVLNLAFRDYAGLFAWFDGNQSCGYPWQPTGDLPRAHRRATLRAVASWLPWSRRWRYWGDTNYDFDVATPRALVDPLGAGKPVYFDAWLFRGFASLAESRAEILNVFRPVASVSDHIGTFLGPLRSTGSTLVGLHVRWEDYRGTDSFIDGPGFRRAIERLQGLLAGRPCQFVVFSNETVPPDEFQGLPVVFSPGPSPVFDLYAMARCDWLMAPPEYLFGLGLVLRWGPPASAPVGVARLYLV